MHFTQDSLLPENQEPQVMWGAQVQTAVDCYNAGATLLHVHVRDPVRPASPQLSGIGGGFAAAAAAEAAAAAISAEGPPMA